MSLVRYCLASGALEQAIYEAFVTRTAGTQSTSSASAGWTWPASAASPWTRAGRPPPARRARCHLRTVSAAIWFGLTTGYLTLTGRYIIPQ